MEYCLGLWSLGSGGVWRLRSCLGVLSLEYIVWKLESKRVVLVWPADGPEPTPSLRGEGLVGCVCECGTRGTLVTLRVEERKRRESGEYWGIKPGDPSWRVGGNDSGLLYFDFSLRVSSSDPNIPVPYLHILQVRCGTVLGEWSLDFRVWHQGVGFWRCLEMSGVWRLGSGVFGSGIGQETLGSGSCQLTSLGEEHLTLTENIKTR